MGYKENLCNITIGNLTEECKKASALWEEFKENIGEFLVREARGGKGINKDEVIGTAGIAIFKLIKSKIKEKHLNVLAYDTFKYILKKSVDREWQEEDRKKFVYNLEDNILKELLETGTINNEDVEILIKLSKGKVQITKKTIEKLKSKIDTSKLQSMTNKRFNKDDLKQKLIELDFDEKQIELILSHTLSKKPKRDLVRKSLQAKLKRLFPADADKADAIFKMASKTSRYTSINSFPENGKITGKKNNCEDIQLQENDIYEDKEGEIFEEISESFIKKESKAEKSEITIKLEKCIEKLNKKQKQVIREYYYQRKNEAKIASEVGCTQSNINLLKDKAINNLRDMLLIIQINPQVIDKLKNEIKNINRLEPMMKNELPREKWESELKKVGFKKNEIKQILNYAIVKEDFYV
ncbi:MAG: sigma-70 family RNA polymerase sigma factor [Candidatus Eremiobacterota bacterium]